MRTRLRVLAFVLLAVACDDVGNENGRGEAVPRTAPPKLSPIELVPPRVDRSPARRVEIRDPPPIDATQVDLHQQSDGIVDILWVLDDSGSMKNQRATLVNNFERFLQELLALDVDFQMGVTSTNASDRGKLRGTTPIIRNLTPDPRGVFEANTSFPDSRVRWEQGLRMAQLAVSSPATDPGQANAGFLRPNAALAIIAVTDEDDGSFGEPAYYTRAFKGVKGKGNENLVSFSIIGGTTPTGCFPPGEQIYYGGLAEPAFRYAAVARSSGGVVGSICNASFEETLLQIAAALNTLRRVFPLSIEPVPGSISVYVNDVKVPRDLVNGWQYRADTRSIAFLGNYVPPPGSQLRIVYAFQK